MFFLHHPGMPKTHFTSHYSSLQSELLPWQPNYKRYIAEFGSIEKRQFCWSLSFCLQNIYGRCPKFCPLNLDMTSNSIFFPAFAFCGNRTSQVFPLVWWAWLDFALNFASKLDVRSGPWPPSMEVPHWVDGWLLLGVCEYYMSLWGSF